MSEKDRTAGDILESKKETTSSVMCMECGQYVLVETAVRFAKHYFCSTDCKDTWDNKTKLTPSHFGWE